jgi:hypothetical protein
VLGHASGDMADLYAAATVHRLTEQANKVSETIDRTTLLRVVSGESYANPHAERKTA